MADDVWEALDLDATTTPVVAIVGGGGKTALLYRLGREAEARGRRAILGGTTRFTRAAHGPMPPLAVADEGAALTTEAARALGRHPVVVAATGHGPQARLLPVSPEDAARLAGLPGLGLLALEADGSKMRPFKAPGAHEPVIPSIATHVVAVVGADAVGMPLDEEHVHRTHQVRRLLDPGDHAQALATHCTVEVLTRVLLHPEGGRKGTGDRTFAVVVNKADAYPEAARRLARALQTAGAPRVIVAALRDDAGPVRDVLTSDSVSRSSTDQEASCRSSRSSAGPRTTSSSRIPDRP